MIDDRIGSIGSTHGVNDKARPIAKNAPTTSQNPSAPAQPAPAEKPLTKEEKAKKKLNDLLGL